MGNLSFDPSQDELHQLFKPYGAVESAKLATDRDTGRTRGFGFVEITSDNKAEAAIAALNRSEVARGWLTQASFESAECRRNTASREYIPTSMDDNRARRSFSHRAVP